MFINKAEVSKHGDWVLIMQGFGSIKKISEDQADYSQKISNPTLSNAVALIQGAHPEYEKILNQGQYEEILNYTYKMLKAGQTPKDTISWIEQFMRQESRFLSRDDPLFTKYNLTADDMIAITRATWTLKKSDGYFAERMKGYKGGDVKYFIDSFEGAFRPVGAFLYGQEIPAGIGGPRNVDVSDKINKKYREFRDIAVREINIYFSNIGDRTSAESLQRKLMPKD